MYATEDECVIILISYPIFFADTLGRARLADFGISRELKEGHTHRTTRPLGTECWMAKETIEEGPVFYRRSSDIQVVIYSA